ncbi:MAG: chorismate lyase [Chromatiales bacterium]
MTEPASILAGAEPRWMPLSSLRRLKAPRGLVRWLADDASLTRRLQCACGAGFHVRVVHQGWGRPSPGESRLLQMRRAETAILRAVELRCDADPWVYARTVIPARSLRGSVRRLARLGSRPLGGVLFADPGVRRGLTQVARLLPGHSLFRAAAASLRQSPEELWGRRTLFYLCGRGLLVNEIYLPRVPSDPTEHRHGTYRD